MTVTRTDVAAQLEYGVRTGFLTAAQNYESKRGPFTRETTSDGAFETYADMGTPPMPSTSPAAGLGGDGGTNSQNNATVVGGLHAGGSRHFNIWGGNERALQVYNQDFPVGIAVFHNAINDNRVNGLEEWASSLGVRYEQFKDKLCFDALNKGEGTTYGNAYDGVPFFSANHKDKNAQYTTVQDNQYTLSLSADPVGNYDTVKNAFAKFKDDRGEPVGNSANLLIVSSDLERHGAQVTQNREVAGTGNRDMNPYAGNVRMLVAPGGYLDDTAWFVTDDSMPMKPVILQIRQEAQLEVFDDYLAGGQPVRYFVWTARYAVAYGDWRLCAQGNT